MTWSASFIVPDTCIPWINKQVTGSPRDAGLFHATTVDDFQLLQDWLKPGGVAMDLGCGVGRWSVYLAGQPGWGNTLFVLADANRRTKKIKYGWRPGRVFYNSLDATRQFVEANGLQQFRLFDVEHDDWSDLPVLGTVVSLLSVGFHWPIEPELKKLAPYLRADTQLVFQVRKKKYTAATFSNEFASCSLRPRSRKSDFLLLQGFRGVG